MAWNGDRHAIDERVLISGTTVRFVQMIVLMLVATSGLATVWSLPISEGDWQLCVMAAGLDPERVTSVSIVRTYSAQEAALSACFAERVPEVNTELLVIAWPLLLLAATALLFKSQRTWKIRWREHLQPLTDETVLAQLRRLATDAGLDRSPDFYIDRTAFSASAVVFGSDRRPAVRLNAGLLFLRERHPEKFRGVVLHEFAHIRNRDVTITYTAVAMWWAFILVVALPFSAFELASLPSRASTMVGSLELLLGIRSLVLELAMLALIYFARTEVLRDRELYADRTARRWGADLRSLIADEKPPAELGRAKRIRAVLRDLMRVHPSLKMRRTALADSAELFVVRAPLVFMTGIAAVFIGDQTGAALAQLPLLPVRAPILLGGLVVAVLVCSVVGIALWRAVVYAALSNTRAPSGVRVGLWLGAGMVVGELIRGRAGEFQLITPHPELLLILFGIGAAFGWWTAASARLWIGVWRGRSIVPVMALVLAGSGLVLGAAWNWWQQTGLVWANGMLFDVGGMAQSFAEGVGVFEIDRTGVVLLGFVLPLMATFAEGTLLWSASAALFVVPLLAWAVRPDRKAPLWTQRKGGRGTWERLPALRRVLWAALVGCVGCWATVVAGMAYVHAWTSRREAPSGLEILLIVGWAGAALVLGAAVAALMAAAIAGRHRLAVALIAANLVVAVGLAGVSALIATDGCIPALTMISARCGAFSTDVSWPIFRVMILAVVVLANALAVVAAAAVAVVVARRARRARTVRRPQRAGGRVWRVPVAAVCAVALGFTLSAELADYQNVYGRSEPGGTDWLPLLAESAEPSAHIRAYQVAAWSETGGLGYLDRLLAAFEGLAPYLDGTVDQALTDAEFVRQRCGDLQAAVAEAEQFFEIPEPSTQELWEGTLDQTGRAAKACVFGIDQRNPALVVASMEGVLDGLIRATETAAMLEELLMGWEFA